MQDYGNLMQRIAAHTGTRPFVGNPDLSDVGNYGAPHMLPVNMVRYAQGATYYDQVRTVPMPETGQHATMQPGPRDYGMLYAAGRYGY